MKKLLEWLDNNLIKIFTIGYIFFITLDPKLPIKMINYTYIAIRADDLYVAFLAVLFIVQLLRRKIALRRELLVPILLYWAAVFASFLWGYFVQKTIIFKHLGLLHSLRRVEYMSMFFIFLSSIRSKKDFLFYLRAVILVIFVVGVYGIGQKFLGWPAVQTMNPEYAKGYLLVLDANARISSTFGGHYDLAAYLVFMIPLILAAFFYFKAKWWYFATFFVALFSLILTASRISYGAYVVSTLLFLLAMRKFKMFFVVALLTVALTLTSGNLTSRLTRTFQQKQIFIDKTTGQTTVPRRLKPNELPVGDYVVNKQGVVSQAVDISSGVKLNEKDASEAKANIRDQIREEAKRAGKTLSQAEEDALVEKEFKNLKVVTTVLPDISFATRLQVEWPRAINAFLKNPLLGKGPSSITEATDNDILRALGETGLFGTLSFAAILLLICKAMWDKARREPAPENILLWALVFSLFGLVINATYIDVFEASKIAYNFWMVAGLFMGYVGLKHAAPKAAEAKTSAKKKK